GARCLDLFAGTGALGLEALSRGAASVAFVERDSTAAASLEQSLRQFGATGGEVHCMDALRYLHSVPQPFDIVFLDPPFDSGELENLCKLLDEGWLAPDARIYLEMSRDRAFPALPADWSVLRDRKAGKVRYALAHSSAIDAGEDADADRRDVPGNV
ncbi:MAG TPA: 16S rRNA (guanine(966)-N(2))-methyltransferase RsmD, partial [Chromatiales bacterium]|nr:16S rRNA (guanine(966)-N(2))-methyltransferase RsmD [Chromatiales bacterium]